MGKGELAPKVEAIYQAVIQLYAEGADLNNLTVAEITAKAGIGKGTAYDYFANKEEMIAGALFYEMKKSCQSLSEYFKREKDLYGKIYALLSQVEKKLAGTGCFFRTLHLMMDHSAMSDTMRKMIRGREKDEILLDDLLRIMIEDELSGTEVLPEDKEYLVLNTISNIICFAMSQYDMANVMCLDNETIKQKICRGVCWEVERLKETKAQ